jgi:hypothetical protein
MVFESKYHARINDKAWTRAPCVVYYCTLGKYVCTILSLANSTNKAVYLVDILLLILILIYAS